MHATCLILALALTGQKSFSDAFDAPISAGRPSILAQAKAPEKPAEPPVTVQSTVSSRDDDLAELNAKLDRLTAAVEAGAAKKGCDCRRERVAGTALTCPGDCDCAVPGACGHDGCACAARRLRTTPVKWELRDVDGVLYKHADKGYLEAWMVQHNQALADARTQVVPRQAPVYYYAPTYQQPAFEPSYGGGFMGGVFSGGGGCAGGGCR